MSCRQGDSLPEEQCSDFQIFKNEFELINNVTSTFKHIKNNKFKYLHINALNLQNIKKNKIISDSDKYINNLTHYLKSNRR